MTPRFSASGTIPTFVDLLELKKPAGPPIDGVSLAPVLRHPEATLPERTLFVHVQRQYLPPKWSDSAVMTRQWRLLHGKELYDIKADPGQERDIADQHPQVVGSNAPAQIASNTVPTIWWWSSLMRKNPTPDLQVSYLHSHDHIYASSPGP